MNMTMAMVETRRTQAPGGTGSILPGVDGGTGGPRDEPEALITLIALGGGLFGFMGKL